MKGATVEMNLMEHADWRRVVAKIFSRMPKDVFLFGSSVVYSYKGDIPIATMDIDIGLKRNSKTYADLSEKVLTPLMELGTRSEADGFYHFFDVDGVQVDFILVDETRDSSGVGMVDYEGHRVNGEEITVAVFSKLPFKTMETEVGGVKVRAVDPVDLVVEKLTTVRDAKKMEKDNYIALAVYGSLEPAQRLQVLKKLECTAEDLGQSMSDVHADLQSCFYLSEGYLKDAHGEDAELAGRVREAYGVLLDDILTRDMGCDNGPGR